MRCFSASTSRPSASTPISDALSHSDTGREWSRCVVVVYAPGRRASGVDGVRLGGLPDTRERAVCQERGVGERSGSEDRGDVGELAGPARSMAHGSGGGDLVTACVRSEGGRALISISVGRVVAGDEDVWELDRWPVCDACVCSSPLTFEYACAASSAPPPAPLSAISTPSTPSAPSSARSISADGR